MFQAAVLFEVTREKGAAALGAVTSFSGAATQMTALFLQWCNRVAGMKALQMKSGHGAILYLGLPIGMAQLDGAWALASGLSTCEKYYGDNKNLLMPNRLVDFNPRLSDFSGQLLASSVEITEKSTRDDFEVIRLHFKAICWGASTACIGVPLGRHLLLGRQRPAGLARTTAWRFPRVMRRVGAFERAGRRPCPGQNGRVQANGGVTGSSL